MLREVDAVKSIFEPGTKNDERLTKESPIGEVDTGEKAGLTFHP